MTPERDIGGSDRDDEPGAMRTRRASDARQIRRGLFWVADTGPFHGYTYGEKWNGWDVPFFAKAEAWKILDVFGESGSYDPAKDAFHFQDPEDPPEFEPLEFAGEDHLPKPGRGAAMRLYPIGSAYWCWEDKTPEASTEAQLHFASADVCDCGYVWPDRGDVDGGGA